MHREECTEHKEVNDENEHCCIPIPLCSTTSFPWPNLSLTGFRDAVFGEKYRNLPKLLKCAKLRRNMPKEPFWRGMRAHDRIFQKSRARLPALREKKPPKKAAQIRVLWPEIKAALDEGHSLKAVCDCLEADGITISVQTLGSYITRMRRKSVPVTRPLLARGNDSVTRQNDPGRIAGTADPKREKSFDPLANIRERQGKRTGFDYRPELADPKQLI